MNKILEKITKQKLQMPLLPLLIAGIFLLAFLIISILFGIRAFRPVKYLIHVEDEVYEKYISKAPLPSEESSIMFVKVSESENAEKDSFTCIIKNAGYIQKHDEIALLPQTYGKNQKFYTLEKDALLPYIPADFTNNKKSINAPDFSVNLSFLNDLPEGSRAIPLNQKYVDAEDYKLAIKYGVLCTLNEISISKEFFEYCDKTFINPEIKKAPQLITIASVGDIMVARGVQEILIDKEDGLKTVFNDTLPILQGCDFTLGNLEGVVTESWKNAIKTYTFKFKKAVLPKLMEAGFDYLMQTNNHCYDYGEQGFKDTLAAFEEYKIPSSGIGYNKEEAQKFYHTNIKGLPIAVISCGAFPVEQSGFNGEKTATATDTRAGILWKSDELLESVKAEKDAGNFVIVNVHGGQEYHFSPSKKQREFYEALCDNGADIVFGSHPHVLQNTEWHGKSLIVYSLGNFIFNGMEGMKGGTDSEIVKVGVLDGKIAYVEQYPVKIKKNAVNLK